MSVVNADGGAPVFRISKSRPSDRVPKWKTECEPAPGQRMQPSNMIMQLSLHDSISAYNQQVERFIRNERDRPVCEGPHQGETVVKNENYDETIPFEDLVPKQVKLGNKGICLKSLDPTKKCDEPIVIPNNKHKTPPSLKSRIANARDLETIAKIKDEIAEGERQLRKQLAELEEEESEEEEKYE